MKTFSPSQLNMAAFDNTSGSLAFDSSHAAAPALSTTFSRLTAQACEPGGLVHVAWAARAERRAGAGGQSEPWLHLNAQALMRLQCQRCLSAAELPLATQRWFRFVADEACAAAQDEVSEEDVLALSARFDLNELVEDELLMAIPLVPMHSTCPQALPMSVADDAFEQTPPERPSAFAALSALKRHG